MTTITLALLTDSALPIEQWAAALAAPLQQKRRSAPRVALHWLKQQGMIRRNEGILELRHGVWLDTRAILSADYDQALQVAQWYGNGLPPLLLGSPKLSQEGQALLGDLQQRLASHVQRLKSHIGRLRESQRARLKAVCDLTSQGLHQGANQEVIPLAQAGAALARQYGVRDWEGTFLQHEATARVQLEDWAGATYCYERSIATLSAVGDTLRVAWATHGLGLVAIEAGQLARAKEILEGLWRQALQPPLRDHVAIDLGTAYYRAGEPHKTIAVLKQVLSGEGPADAEVRLTGYLNLAWAAFAAQKPRLAVQAYRTAAALADSVPRADAEVRVQVLKAVLSLSGLLPAEGATGWATLRRALIVAGRRSVALQHELESYVAQTRL
ncbi:MAG: hypothetical protein HY335_04090 [Deinococcus sp.]|nr:hypothetical protein [Deinococcus sp.]